MPPYSHPLLGPVNVVRSTRARRLTLSVRASGEVRLTIPPGVSRDEALRFLDEKQQWAGRARERLRQRHPPQRIGPVFSTRRHVLELIPGTCAAPSFQVRNGVIRVCHPAALGHEDESVQRTIQQGIEQAWRIEAKQYLPARVAQLCRTLGFRCGTVTIRNSRSRWGSCSASNDLSLSLHLMKLPDRLIDYIITHELCHTRHKNHGPAFHALLDNMTAGRHLQLRQELKGYSTRWN